MTTDDIPPIAGLHSEPMRTAKRSHLIGHRLSEAQDACRAERAFPVHLLFPSIVLKTCAVLLHPIIPQRHACLGRCNKHTLIFSPPEVQSHPAMLHRQIECVKCPSMGYCHMKPSAGRNNYSN